MAIKSIVLRLLRRSLSLCPRSRRLPLSYWLHVFFESPEPELDLLPSLVPRRTVAVDIGANVGFYAFRMSKLFSKVYAFEINEDLTSDLAAYNAPNIEIINVGLSAEAVHATLYIPVLNGVPLTGWASLAPGNCPDATEHLTKPVNVQTLDSFHLEGVAFIKIDVEGHELHVLRGARRTLVESGPTVLVEIKAHNREAVFQFFSDINYTHRVLRPDIGSTENFVFAPGGGEAANT